MILTRPDFAIIDLAVVLTIPASRRRALRSALVALAIALPWHVVSWFALGSALPDTLLTRMDESWGTTYATGLAWYFQHWSAATGVTVLLLLCGLAAACWAWSVRAKRAGPAQATLGFAAGGAAHAMAFALLAPPPVGEQARRTRSVAGAVAHRSGRSSADAARALPRAVDGDHR